MPGPHARLQATRLLALQAVPAWPQGRGVSGRERRPWPVDGHAVGPRRPNTRPRVRDSAQPVAGNTQGMRGTVLFGPG